MTSEADTTAKIDRQKCGYLVEKLLIFQNLKSIDLY